MQNKFRAQEIEIDKEERSQIATVVYGESETELRVKFYLTIEDEGIGFYECHGMRGYDSRIIYYTEEIESVELVTIANQDEITAFVNRTIGMSEEERNAMYDAGDRFPRYKYEYTEININEDKIYQIIEAINEVL